ncbi:MAG: hypothetical protein NZ601_06155, partial [candidate division WOR-3 bacterium]|nr:hypothetical protein [candidate division WOR-3 bacterium]MDW7988054.1 hypothetical protein [candidate division WOR-3 bacterium]
MQLIILLTIVNQLTFAPKFDPNLKWQKLTTAHFNVYFSNHGILKNNEEIAKMVTWYCEDAHRKLTSFMGYAPYGKTNVIIGDFYDYPTGWATTFPQNTIFINLALPKELKVYYRNWLEHLILHEYTHILTMDMVFGLNKYSRKIFGRIITPNVLLPLFLTEGYAIYNETKFTKKGRLNSSYYQMIMRAKILDNKIFPLDKWVTYELAEFPGGETPYFYGGSFLYYLAEEYGEEKIIKFVQNHSKGFPLFFNCYAKRIWQKNFFKLWHDFKIQTIKKYQSQINELQSKPLTPYQKLTTIGYYVNSPIYAPDGQKIYFTSQSSHEQTTLWELDLITKKKKSLLKANISSPIRISPDGKKIVFCIRDYYNNFYYYDDLYLFELQSKKLKRLTQKMRTADPCFFSSNDKIVFVKNEFGEYSINVLELSTGIITTILESNDCEQYLSPCPSPDGKKLALIIRTPEGNIDLFIYDLVTEWLIPITHNTALELTPCWSQNNYLFFVSDLNKVFNIYAYNIKNEAFYQITNVLTGAFAPSIAPNNQELLFLVYSSKGYDICYTKINYDSLYSISPIPEKTLDAYKTEKNSSEPDTIYGVLSNYSSITSLFPKFWLPLFTYNQSDKWSYGALTYGSDILFKHQYLFYALYKKPLNKSLIHFEYLLNCFYPEVSMRFSYQNNTYLLGINSCFPYIKNEYRFSFTVSYFYEKKNLQTGT